jgi:hypothetical protein
MKIMNQGDEIADNLLLSSCYGLGMGTTRSPKAALSHSIRAALRGDLSALLTSISLFDVLQTYSQVAEYDLKSIARWKEGHWDIDYGSTETTRCSSILPSIFDTTPCGKDSMQRLLNHQEEVFVYSMFNLWFAELREQL